MRLEEYWGVGPKTSEVLSESLEAEAAIEAIEAGDLRQLVATGLSRGRATRILRHAQGGAAMDLLATGDTRRVYKDLLDVMVEFAVSPDAADRVRIRTPLASPGAMRERLKTVETARVAWTALTDEQQATLLAAFGGGNAAGHATGDTPAGGALAAVQTARMVQDLDPAGEIFDAVMDLDPDRLAEADRALSGLGLGTMTPVDPSATRIQAGADDGLDESRAQLQRLEDLAGTPNDLLETVTSDARGAEDLREAAARAIADESGVPIGDVREAMPRAAVDAEDFVSQTLRDLRADLQDEVSEREQTVATELADQLERAEATVEGALAAVDDLAEALSLARFAEAFGLASPRITEDRSTLAVSGARNLFLAANDAAVQPITYAVGDHDLAVARAIEPPSGDRVAVLTGANSGGKTTLLETLCQVQLLAQMGLPVPADSAEVAPVDTIVFHRRHASFNAGVLESTLRSVVPPLTGDGRTLMLVDEFEAITEPGSAADLLHGLVTLTVEEPALGVFVTHLADDLEPLPDPARTDGIFAEGLTPDLTLEVDYQPHFDTVGKSTPEFIVSRLVAEASDGYERAGYRALVEAVGEEAVQRTLADAAWTE